LAFLWDRRFEQRLRKQLGDPAFNHLRAIIPPTWIVGQERFFAPGMPDGLLLRLILHLCPVQTNACIKRIRIWRKKLWAEGVKFLHDQSANTARALLQQLKINRFFIVVQQLIKHQDIPMTYEAKTDNSDSA